MAILDVTDSSFDREVLKNTRPVVVDFWAEWCAPCRALAPVMAEIATERGEAIQICKMDVDASPSVPAQYSVKSIPTLLFFKDGKVVDSLVGAVPKRQIDEKLEAILA